MNEDTDIDTIVVDLEDLRLRQDLETMNNDFLREQMTRYRRAMWREYGTEEEPTLKGFLGQFYPENVTIDERFHRRGQWHALWDEAGPPSKWYKHFSLNRALKNLKTKKNRRRERGGGSIGRRIRRRTLKKRYKSK